MNVLQLISSSGYYGAENMLIALTGGLGRLGCRGAVGVFRDARFEHLEIAERARERGIPIEIVPCNGRWDLHAVERIRKILDDREVDVLHTHGYKADVMGCAAAWSRRTALVATCHNWPDRSLKMLGYAWLDRRSLRKFDAVAAASEPVAEILKQSGIRGVQVVSNGVDTVFFNYAKPTIRQMIPSGCEQVVGFVGRMVPEKGGTYFLRCAKKVLDVRPQTAFVFVGEGPSRPEWEALGAELGISGNVVFTGVREDMPGVYASLDVLVLPSLTEATPMCLLEALAGARPVIAANVGSVPKVVIPGVTGLLVEPADAEGLADAILRLLADPVFARDMAERGRAHVARYFSADASATVYAALYAQAITRRAKRHEPH